MALTRLLCAAAVLAAGGAGARAEDSPLAELASSLLQSLADGGGGGGGGLGGLGALGGLVGQMMQGDGAKNLGALLGQAGGGGGGAADVLAGLGSLLGGQNGQLDPSVVGSVVSMFAQQLAAGDGAGGAGGVGARARREEPAGVGAGAGAGLLPLVLGALGSFSEAEAQRRGQQHEDHAAFLPPYLEKAHVYWDVFINSELGRTLWERSGLARALQAFAGADGRVSVDLMMRSFENLSFRRHWIRAAARSLADAAVAVSRPEVYQRYLSTAQQLAAAYLPAGGAGAGAGADWARPEAAVSQLANRALKHYLDLDTDVTAYVAPAVQYLQETLKMAASVGQSLSSRADRAALTDRVTDALNLEVIEPVLRVHRAYRHARRAPPCARQLLCLVNRRDDARQALPGFKAGLTRLGSAAAAAALSAARGGGFWDLYAAVQSDADCEKAYPADCAAFHEHEQKVTTEVYHSEL